jgi:hypothetical protein
MLTADALSMTRNVMGIVAFCRHRNRAYHRTSTKLEPERRPNDAPPGCGSCVATPFFSLPLIPTFVITNFIDAGWGSATSF